MTQIPDFAEEVGDLNVLSDGAQQNALKLARHARSQRQSTVGKAINAFIQELKKFLPAQHPLNAGNLAINTEFSK